SQKSKGKSQTSKVPRAQIGCASTSYGVAPTIAGSAPAHDKNTCSSPVGSTKAGEPPGHRRPRTRSGNRPGDDRSDSALPSGRVDLRQHHALGAGPADLAVHP